MRRVALFGPGITHMGQRVVTRRLFRGIMSNEQAIIVVSSDSSSSIYGYNIYSYGQHKTRYQLSCSYNRRIREVRSCLSQAEDAKQVFRKQFLQKEYNKVAIDVVHIRGKKLD